RLIAKANKAAVDFIFVGGSLLSTDRLQEVILLIKSATSIPVIIFPGSANQICDSADGILLLSLISGRNPEFLIGAHVTAAARLRVSGIEILPTAYMLIDGGAATTVSYISNTL